MKGEKTALRLDYRRKDTSAWKNPSFILQGLQHLYMYYTKSLFKTISTTFQGNQEDFLSLYNLLARPTVSFCDFLPPSFGKDLLPFRFATGSLCAFMLLLPSPSPSSISSSLSLSSLSSLSFSTSYPAYSVHMIKKRSGSLP